MHSNIRLISSTVPMIVDMDTGFGGPVTIRRAIREYEQMLAKVGEKYEM